MKKNDSAIFGSVKQFIDGYASQDLEACMSAISASVPVVFLGTNLDEVFQDRDSIRTALVREFQSISDLQFGEDQQLFSHDDNMLASLIVEYPISFKVGEDYQQSIFRYAFNLNKEEDGQWRIYACSVSVPFNSGTLNFDNT